MLPEEKEKDVNHHGGFGKRMLTKEKQKQKDVAQGKGVGKGY